MASVALYRKYRPQIFEDVLGQEHVTQTLQAAIKDDRIAHAFLFSGSRGTGKTSTARILAKALNCEKGPTPTPCNACETCRAITEGSSLDVIEIDAASHGGVDDVRDLRENALLAPAIARRKIYIVDEAHMVSTQGWNAFLKTVEEPPEHVIFVFATTEPHKVLPTILSRCQRFDFRRVSSSLIAGHLAKLCAEEGIDADEGALQLVARAAEGGVRDSLSTLDQLASTGSVTLADAARLLGTMGGDALFEFTDALALNDTASAVRLVARFVEEGHDMRVLAREVLEHVRALLLVKQVDDPSDLLDVTEETRARLDAQAERFGVAKLTHLMRLFTDALVDMRNQATPRLTIELAVLRATMPEVDDTAAGAVSRIERIERILEVGGAPAPAQPAAPSEAESKPKAAASKKSAPTKRAASTKSAAPKEEAAPGSEQPTAAGALDLDKLRRSWTLVLEEVRKASKRVHSYLMDAQAVAMEGTTLTLEHRFSWHAEQLVAAKNAQVIAAAVNQVLGVAPKIAARVADAPIEDETKQEYVDAGDEGEAPDALDVLKAGFGDDIKIDE